ncbi:hypothetical protein ACEPPN_015418 [Leptodophora sp. 'Broadleaf-Isolate-01']
MPMPYRPLRPDTREIRLLEILDIKSEERLSFRLRHVPLDTAPTFLAISYAWGNFEDELTIYVDGHSFEVSRNLFDILVNRISFFFDSGLQKHRDEIEYMSRFLWVDAICINQTDLTERAQQILLMGKIYQTGIVCICLDSGNEELDRTASHAIWRIHGQLNDKLEITISDNEWLAMHQLFTKAWFKRMWVIQELCLSSMTQCTVFNGHRPISMANLWTVTLELFKLTPTTLSISQKRAMRDGMKEYLCLVGIKLDLEHRPFSNLATSLLWIFRDRLATNPRDKIYSLMGLIKEASGKRRNGSENYLVHVTGVDLQKLINDYGATVEDIFESLVESVISTTGSLNIICASQFPSSFTRSWVPNWADAWERYSILLTSMDQALSGAPDGSSEQYNASASTSPSVSISKDRTTLTVRGLQWDRILSLYDPPVFPCKECPTIYLWASKLFDQLDPDLRRRLIGTYGEATAGDKDVEISAFFQWCKAIHGGPFRNSHARGRDHWHFYGGASQEWHAFSDSFHHGNLYFEDFTGKENEANLEMRCIQIGHRRKIFISERGYCGLVSDSAKISDALCVFLGCDVPVLIRGLEKNQYSFIGEAYVQGLMDGEAMEALKQGDAELIDIELV